MFDFKYHSVRLKLMHSVGHHQAVQNSRPNISSVLNLFLSVGMYRIIAFCLGTVHYLLGVRDQCFGVRDKDFF